MSLLQLNDVVVGYRIKYQKKLVDFFKKPQYSQVIKKISFSVKEGEVLGIVGESGCGKTTLMKAILGEISIISGSIFWKEKPILNYSKKERAKNIQFIFQNAAAAMNPKMNVYEIVSEPLNLISNTNFSAEEKLNKVYEMLEVVGLSKHFVTAYPSQFSGGEAQRVAIARALISRPKLLICDEPVSALDVSIQAKIINLLVQLNKRFRLSIIFISHNLLVIRQIADHVLVMYSGVKVEYARMDNILFHPRHPYTSALWSAVPLPSVTSLKSCDTLLKKKNELQNSSGSQDKCVFYSRCPYAKEAFCSQQPPESEISLNHHCACSRAKDLEDQLWHPHFI